MNPDASDVQTESVQALVVGGGPAGLMAAGELARSGAQVILCDAKPSVARKFLMAGKSGLNLTLDTTPDRFAAAYAEAAGWLAPMFGRFGPKEVQQWARDLGQEVFTGSSGRVFPVSMKASPLLRAWLAELAESGVRIRPRWRWTGWKGPDALCFDTPQGPCAIRAEVCVLALGGASWARLGSDGAWAGLLAARGVALHAFQPSNMGVRVGWSDHMRAHFGAPLKGVALGAGSLRVRGECVISASGIEGGGIYALGRALRAGAALRLDLFPDLTRQQIAERLAARPKRESTPNRLRKAVRLGGVRLALVNELARPIGHDPTAIAQTLKALRVPLKGFAPIDEAISTAGGVAQRAVDSGLMLKALPGIFVAGEMLDWDAPTGGHLITACLATGLHAGRAGASWRQRQGGSGA